MKADIKKKWIEALRSGKYTQGKRYLKNGNTYCCVGVLCDVIGVEWKPINAEKFEGIPNTVECIDDYIYAIFPEGYLNKLGLRSKSEEHYSFGSLYHMNDTLDYSFDQIADEIENRFTGE